MNRTLAALSLLLQYPGEELKRASTEIGQALVHDGRLPAARAQALTPLIERLADGDLLELQENYVWLFDRTRSLSLHLFEHIHGEGRDRGQAMVDLQAMYAANGLVISASELPDYLPLFLEFLACLDDGEARALLGETVHVIFALHQRLLRRHSDYAPVMAALEALADVAGVQAPTLAAIDEAAPDDLEALDRVWEDRPVEFCNAGGRHGTPSVTSVAVRLEPARNVR